MLKHYKKVRNCLAILMICLGQAAYAQQITVSGKVTSADDGLGLPGVNVIEKGTSNGAVTDSEGVYKLSVTSNAILLFSYVGYESQEVAVNGKKVLDVTLVTDATMLSEVVVVGYGSQKKLDVTGSVVSVKGDEISKQSSINPISGLQGKVAGVQITNSGAPGSAPQITIRGIGSLYGSSAPLYVVDGVWYSDITFLNPADIENISVLKDASSTAIYGIRAANGVVLISTKRGLKNQKATINYNGFIGSQVVSNTIDMASGPEYATAINELDEINGATPRYDNPNSFGTTDWNRQILRSALISNHQVSVAGGSEKSTYNFSFGYLKQEGTVETNSFKRYTARLQNDFEPLDFIKVGYTVAGTVNNSNDIPGGIFHELYAAAPNVPVFYSDGAYGDPLDFKSGSSTLFNPQATIDFFDQNTKNYRITGNLFAEAKVGKLITLRSSIGGDYGFNEVVAFRPIYTATFSQRNAITQLNRDRTDSKNWILENTLTFDKVFGAHGLKVLLGQTAQHSDFYSLRVSSRNMPDNSSGDHYLSLGDISGRLVNDGGDIENVASYFARLNYSYNEKYVLNASWRADGSSKFLGKNQWGYFPSIGLGWVISEEGFMKGISQVNSLKLRASWGKIGNKSNLPNQPAVLKVTQIDEYAFPGGGGAAQVGANVVTLVPPVLFWEKGEGIDVGIEASLLKNKLFAEIDFYSKKTLDAIFDIRILGSLGTSGGQIFGNQANIENKGFELLLRWNDNINQDLSYSISGNLGVNENKVTSVLSGRTAVDAGAGVTGGGTNTRTVVDQPIGSFFGYETIGIFQTTTDISNYQSTDGTVIQPSAKPGDFKFRDINDDGQINGKDRQFIGNPNPKYTFGINTTFNYKSFDLSVDFQGVAGVDVYNANLGLRFGTENFTKDFYDNRWHGEGTSSTYPSANIGGGANYLSNSFYVEKGDYFRVRNIQLGYSINPSLVTKAKITKLRVFVNAQNALNFFKYKGFNPEIGGGALTRGIDIDVYPLYATYNAGVNITF